MAQRTHYIAVDLGAESGRVMLATLENETFTLRQAHRFSNGPVREGDSLRWDVQRLIDEITVGIKAAMDEAQTVAGLGLDTWGVDFGLMDADGNLMEKPYHYRDSRTEGMIDEACRIVGKWELYANSGIQFMPFNTLFQLLGCKHRTPEPLGKATQLLFMPNLLMTLLGARPCAEYTIASTSQMMDMHTGQWSKKLLNALDLSIEILPEVVNPGRQIGVLNPAIARNKDGSAIPILTVGTHDTASAVAAVPAVENRPWACLSSGTWSLMGIETPSPIITPKTFEYALTNEGGVEHTIALLRNIMGLWLVQECRRQWETEGQALDYATIADMATAAEPFTAWIDPDDMTFFAPGDMPGKINAFLTQTGQTPIQDKGRMIRVILESLAMRYRQVLRMLEDVSGQTLETLHIIGGGTQNELLNQLTADATGKTVITGPVEATVLGNVLIQAKACGQIRSLAHGRRIIADSFPTQTYTPRPDSRWAAMIKRLENNLS